MYADKWTYPTDDQVRLAAQVFRMLADPTRIRLPWMLVHGELSVNELADGNAEHAGTGVPAHHHADADVQVLASDRDRTRRAGQR